MTLDCIAGQPWRAAAQGCYYLVWVHEMSTGEKQLLVALLALIGAAVVAYLTYLQSM